MKHLLIISILFLTFFACKQQKKHPEPTTSTYQNTENSQKKAPRSKMSKKKTDFDYLEELIGSYVSEGYPNGFYKKIDITKVNRGELHAQVTSFNANGNEFCKFDANGTVGYGTLLLATEWDEQRMIVSMKLKSNPDQLLLDVMSDEFQDGLKSFCNNDLSLYGTYTRLKK